MNDATDRPPRFAIVVSELLIVVGIISAISAFLLPAVNAAREIQGRPILLPALHSLYSPHPWIFVIGVPAAATTVFAIALLTIRQLLPQRARRFIVWRSPPLPKLPPPGPINDWRPAALTAFTSIAAASLAVFAASHLRVDRRIRRPVITWEAPLGQYAQHMAVFAWLLSALAFVLGIYAIHRYRSRLNSLAVFGVVLSGLNCFASCVFYAAAFED